MLAPPDPVSGTAALGAEGQFLASSQEQLVLLVWIPQREPQVPSRLLVPQVPPAHLEPSTHQGPSPNQDPCPAACRLPGPAVVKLGDRRSGAMCWRSGAMCCRDSCWPVWFGTCWHELLRTTGRRGEAGARGLEVPERLEFLPGVSASCGHGNPEDSRSCREHLRGRAEAQENRKGAAG